MGFSVKRFGLGFGTQGDAAQTRGYAHMVW